MPQPRRGVKDEKGIGRIGDFTYCIPGVVVVSINHRKGRSGNDEVADEDEAGAGGVHRAGDDAVCRDVAGNGELLW